MDPVKDTEASDLVAALRRHFSHPETKDDRPSDEIMDRLVLAMNEDGNTWGKCRAAAKEWGKTNDLIRWTKKRKADWAEAKSTGQEQYNSTKVASVWTDIGDLVHPKACCPEGFGFGDAKPAIYQLVERTIDGQTFMKKMPVSLAPVFVRRRILNEDRSVSLELVWRVGKKWSVKVYPREHIMDSSTIVKKTAGDGVPVASTNAPKVVEFLQAYEDTNLAMLEFGYSSSSMGWKGEGRSPTSHGFLCGFRQLGGNGKAFELRTLGAGDVEEAEEIQQAGSFDTWKESIASVWKWPAVRIALYASMCTPLLAILNAPNAIVEWVNRTSTGKTRVMQISQSVWRRSSYEIPGWNATLSNFESKAHLNTDMPLFLDDTKLAIENKGREVVGRAIYQFVAGVGRGRDARDGGQRSTARWRSVMLSTGEQPSSDIARAEGAAARVLSLWAPPVGSNDPMTGAVIDDLVEHTLAANFGHAGPRVILWLHEHRAEWDRLREHYDATTKKIREKFKTTAAARLSRVIALLEVSEIVARESGVLASNNKPFTDDEEIMAMITESLSHAATSSDLAQQALQHMVSYAESRASQWVTWGSEPKETMEPAQGWLGWRRENEDGSFLYGWLPSQLRRMLSDSGFQADAILRAWGDTKVLQLEKGRLDKAVRCGGPMGKERAKLRRLMCVFVGVAPDPEGQDDAPSEIPEPDERWEH